MKLLILVRHGESEANVRKILSDHADLYPLTEKGRKQAGIAARNLAGIRFNTIFSSPVIRARQTAEIIASELDMEYRVDERIRETGMGELNGLTSTEARMSIENGIEYESWESHVERIENFMNGVEGRVIAVSHAMPIRVAVSCVLGLGKAESEGIDIPNSSITAIDLENRKVLCIGSSVISPALKEKILIRDSDRY